MQTFTLLLACGLTVFLGNLIFFGGYFPMKKIVPRIAQRKDSLFQLNSSCLHADESDDFPDGNCYVKPLYDRLVFVVIDAMRKDFILESRASQHLTRVDEVMTTFKKENLKYVNRLLKSREALTFESHVLPPTVTLSGIKTLTTGAVSAFVDILWNFGSGALTDDNILVQLKRTGKRMLFYGDETWLKLFPGVFQEFDGTSSFFVNDYTEVDLNVTRHLEEATNRTDWDCLFLHYLGLDHVGHLSGPSSAPVGPKLREMDRVVEYLKTSLDEKDESERRRTLLVLTSDHGMTDDGNHGGSSPDELSTPLVFVGSAFKRSTSSARKEASVNQVDIVPTLSLLLGIPIPSNSVGVVVPQTLESLGVAEVLKAFDINGRQLLGVLEKNVDDFRESEHHELFQKTSERHQKLLQMASSFETDEAWAVLSDYKKALDGLSRELVSSMSKYDLPTLYVASLLVGLCSITLVWRLTSPVVNPGGGHEHLVVPAIVSVIGGGVHLFLLSPDGTAWWMLLATETLVIISLFVFTKEFVVSLHQLSARIRYVKKSITRPVTGLAVVGVVLHCLSMLSSSFVEEEQNTHHFLVVSFLLLVLFLLVKDASHHFDRDWLLRPSGRDFLDFPRNVRDVSYASRTAKAVLGIVAVSMSCRVAKAWNRTGDKWKHLEDVGDWLNRQENDRYLLLVVAVSMATLLVLEVVRCRGRKFTRLFLTCGFVSSFVHQLLGRQIDAFLSGNTKSREEIRIVTAQISLGASTLVFVTSCFGGILALLRKNAKNGDGRVILCQVAKDFRLSLVMMSLTLCRPHNIVLVLLSYVSASFLHLFFGRSSPSPMFGPGTKAVFYLWMGQTFYYYQGNSNNLTTIDFSVGNIGQRSYSFLVATSLTFVHTFSSIMFWLVSLVIQLLTGQKAGPSCGMKSASPFVCGADEDKVCDDLHQHLCFPEASFQRDVEDNDDDDDDLQKSSTKSSTQADIQRASLALLTVQSFCSSFYLVVMIMMRYHLFVWSVFAPKFLYVVVLHLLVALFVLLCNVTLKVYF